ncbi:MAG: hypothetical protein AAFR04_10185 [Pseudomonadota bacterium]
MKMVHAIAVAAICVVGLGGSIGAGGGTAMAFQETQLGGEPQAPAAKHKLKTDLNAAKPVPSAKPSEGTEIRLPVIGVIGKLPKLDFGLELLYGADGKPPVPAQPNAPAGTPSGDDADDNGLTVRGTVKHRF